MLASKFNQCLHRIRNGDTQALSDIYDEYYQKMIFTALAKVKNLEVAKDIASDFIKYILEKANEIDNVKNPDAWIYTAIKRDAIDHIRKNSNTVYIDDISEENFAHVVNYDLYCAFNNDFKNLSESEQELVILHFFYGLKYREIALETNKPIGTIKSDISIIKKKLAGLKNYL